MTTVAHYVEVQAPADRCYQWWRPLTHLPQIFTDVERVEPTTGDADVTHWTVAGPGGVSVSWDARIVDEESGRKIAWASLPESNNTVDTGGAVRFDDHGEHTGVEVSLHIDPPAGTAGEVAMKLFDDPQRKVEDALAQFKALMEDPSPPR